jgi:hypothetical protein
MQQRTVTELLEATPGIDVLVALTQIDPHSLPASDRIDYLTALEKQAGWLQALMQVAIVAVAGSQADEDGGHFSGVDDPQREEVASALNLPPVTAQSKIDVARTLTQHLPTTCAALANGEISSAQASVIAKESANLIRDGINPDQLKFLEETAIAFSEFHTPVQVTNKLRSLVAKMKPREFEEVVAEAVTQRRVIYTAQPHGMAQILALLPAVEAQTLWLAIDKMARNKREKTKGESRLNGLDQRLASRSNGQLCKSSEEESDYSPVTQERSISQTNSPVSVKLSERSEVRTFTSSNHLEDSDTDFLTLDQLRADALAELAERYLKSTADLQTAHGRPVTLNITLDLPTFLGMDEKPGVLDGYGEIPASIARELAKDAKWRRFITDPITGNLLDYGRITYEPPQALIDFIVARDRRCRFPGCRQPARVCDIDHAIPWEDGGETSRANLGLLCRRHHRMKTHGGWHLESFSDGSCEWTSPEGKKFFIDARPIDEIA